MATLFEIPQTPYITTFLDNSQIYYKYFNLVVDILLYSCYIRFKTDKTTQTEGNMKYDFSYIYSKKAASTILNRKDVVKVEIWGNCCFVKFSKGSPRFVSKKAFTGLFARNRQTSGAAIAEIGAVDHVGGGLYTVISQSQNEVYHVELDTDHLTCNCMDYSVQFDCLKIKKATCKHGYAVLKTLGYGTLSDYIADKGFYRALPLAM